MKGETSSPVAVISGGSSGIGLEIARDLRARGFDLYLIARDPERLARAEADLAAAPGGLIALHALDVCDADACRRLLEEIHAARARLDWLVTSAGIAEPGLFLDQAPDAHRRQMEINYFGTLNLVQPAAALMAGQHAGRIVMLSSAAAFTGIIGYAAYGPTKAAIKALGEALYAELGAKGISVSVAFPQDTDTPQLAAEERLKPEVTKRITAGGGIVSARAMAGAIVTGAMAGRRAITLGWLIRLQALFHSLHTGFFLAQQRRLLEGAKERTKQEPPRP